MASWLGNRRRRARQNNPEFGKLAGFGVDGDRTCMLFHDDVMTDRKPQSGALSSRLGGEERIEHLGLHLGRNARAIVANPDLDAVAEIFCRRREDGFKTIVSS